jgi:hypothetical protein
MTEFGGPKIDTQVLFIIINTINRDMKAYTPMFVKHYRMDTKLNLYSSH